MLELLMKIRKNLEYDERMFDMLRGDSIYVKSEEELDRIKESADLYNELCQAIEDLESISEPIGDKIENIKIEYRCNCGSTKKPISVIELVKCEMCGQVI